ncbi:class I SAM-dependent methyltransferase [Chryseobacterium sp. BIGb0232]|uniref:class I SAM-dependent methyltransferase n=1 Tax=Chryseobacterium sp. BIGb0232 TaxID=2940598 RepID=UPI000F46B544|nr:class I SAM-dependent methyltransferase [Chryseobacterium sp. BIGb0232]MCS4301124.1 SAM-dependent methyltransferase [Chryseobacterium sp. BIGb0232]ROS20015.1 methyltransferase family protein [Chryseobacterium nakagawai]
MKITKLVILFNYKKILLGIGVSLFLFILSFQLDSAVFAVFLRVWGVLIILNIIASLLASYILYDTSDLYELNDSKEDIDWSKIENAVLIHASFDPLSLRLEEKYPHLDLTVCDIYGNRHEHESGIEVSKKMFPPNPKEIKISPDKLPFDDHSQDVILAVTALHEILDHEKRVLFFKEAKRILKKGGIIIISEQFRDTTNFIFFNIGAFHFLSWKQWKSSIAPSGLKIIRNKKITPFANMLIVRKD